MFAQIFWITPSTLAVLALAALLYYLPPFRKQQNAILLLLGGYVTWMMSPVSFVLLFATSFFEHGIAGRILGSSTPKDKLRWLGVSVAMNTAVVVVILSQTLQAFFLGGLRQAGIFDALSRYIQIGFPGTYFIYVILARITLSLDAFKGRLKSVPSLLDAMVYSTFFVRHLGIPLDRARDTLPLLSSARKWSWDNAEETFWLVLVGLFKVIALHTIEASTDRLLGPTSSGLGLIAGAWLVPVRFYLEMSGCVDILRGLAIFMGIRLPEIFNAPYLSTNISEFWKRWNIPIMNWLYEESFSRISFALRHWGVAGIAIACLFTFVGSGIAHGLNLSTVLWGVSQVVPFLVYTETRTKIRKWAKMHGNPRWFTVASWLTTAHIIVFSWAFLSTGSVRVSIAMIKALTHGPLWPTWAAAGIPWVRILVASVFCLAVQIIPHFKGGDTWMRAYSPKIRIPAGIALGGVLFALKDLIPAP